MEKFLVYFAAFLLFGYGRVETLTSETEDPQENGEDEEVYEEEHNNKTERDLVNHLLNGYNNISRPVIDPHTVVRVGIDFQLTDIDELDERNEVLLSFGWFTLYWQDEYLVWTPKEYGDMTYIVLPSKYVWKPDILISNSVTEVHNEVVNRGDLFRVEVEHDGYVTMWTAGRMATSCSVNMLYFPFDEQTCQVEFFSISYGPEQMLTSCLYKEGLMDMEFVDSGQWSMKEGSCSVAPDTRKVTFSYLLKRKPYYYMSNLVAPCIIISLLVPLVFLLPPASGEKVSLSITVLLTFLVFQLLIADSMPRTSDYMPILGIYLLTSMILSAFSLLLTVIVLHVYHNPSVAPPPKCLMRIVCSFCCRRRQKAPLDTSQEMESRGETNIPVLTRYPTDSETRKDPQRFWTTKDMGDSCTDSDSYRRYYHGDQIRQPLYMARKKEKKGIRQHRPEQRWNDDDSYNNNNTTNAISDEELSRGYFTEPITHRLGSLNGNNMKRDAYSYSYSAQRRTVDRGSRRVGFDSDVRSHRSSGAASERAFAHKLSPSEQWNMMAVVCDRVLVVLFVLAFLGTTVVLLVVQLQLTRNKSSWEAPDFNPTQAHSLNDQDTDWFDEATDLTTEAT